MKPSLTLLLLVLLLLCILAGCAPGPNNGIGYGRSRRRIPSSIFRRRRPVLSLFTSRQSHAATTGVK
jgi:hypothetical protein